MVFLSPKCVWPAFKTTQPSDGYTGKDSCAEGRNTSYCNREGGGIGNEWRKGDWRKEREGRNHISRDLGSIWGLTNVAAVKAGFLWKVCCACWSTIRGSRTEPGSHLSSTGIVWKVWAAKGLIYLCRSYRGIQMKLRRFHNQLRVPHGHFKKTDLYKWCRLCFTCLFRVDEGF